MRIEDYLIDQSDKDWSDLLAEWTWLLPENFTLWMVNRFGDLIYVLENGSVHMLDVGGGCIDRLADNRDDFADEIDQDNNANQWLMIPLVQHCVKSGMLLKDGQCYGYKMPPVLGGEYCLDNIEPTDLSVHYSFLGQIHEQVKDLPDGSQVRIKLSKDEA